MTNFFEEMTDHEQASLDRNVEIFRNATNFQKILSLFAEFVQQIESVLIDFRDNRDLQHASGLNLNAMGQLLDVARNNLGDEPYRRVLQAAYTKIIASGQIEPLISAFKLMVTANKIITRPCFPASLIMTAQVDETNVTDAEHINNNMQSIRAGGVRLDVGVAKSNRSFRYASVDGRTGTGRGFADNNDPSVIGGEYGHILR